MLVGKSTNSNNQKTFGKIILKHNIWKWLMEVSVVHAALFFWHEYYVPSSFLAFAHALSSTGLLYLATPTHLSKPLCRHNFLQEALCHCPVLGWVTIINHYSPALPKLVHVSMTIKTGCVVICFPH